MVEPEPKISMREYLDYRFDSLEKKIDVHCAETERLEVRIRKLEAQTSWQWVGQIIGGIAAVFGIRTGFGE